MGCSCGCLTHLRYDAAPSACVCLATADQHRKRPDDEINASRFAQGPHNISKSLAESRLFESLPDAQRINRRKMNDTRDPFVSRLPREIACHIFSNFLPTDVDDFYSVPCQPYLVRPISITPLYLGAVCQSWREIVWATPMLWSSISVDMFAISKITAQLVHDWLGRSGQLPLYIRLHAGIEHGAPEHYPIPSHCDVHARRVIDAVNAYANRWTYIDLELPTSFMLHVRCFSGPKSAMVKTLRLNLLASDVFEPPLDRTMQIGLYGNLSPTKLLIRGLHLSQVGIQWNGLTRVEAFDLSLAECLDLLRIAPAMTHLLLTRLSKVGTCHTSGQQLVFCHRELRSLSLRTVYRYAVAALDTLFERTSFPALTHLVFEQVPIFSESSVKALIDNITRSESCLLNMEIKISTLPIDCSKAIAMFHALPTLETLALELGRYEDTPCLDPILTALVMNIGNNGRVLLPRLKSLTIRKTRFTWDRLFQILPPYHLSSLLSLRIILPCTQSLNDDVVRELSNLKRRGTKAQLLDTNGYNLNLTVHGHEHHPRH